MIRIQDILDIFGACHPGREAAVEVISDPHCGLIAVLTPKGAVKVLPRGATPVDFAYQIHTEVGDRCIAAKVNGRLTPLFVALRLGDTVEIITFAQGRPRRDWLAFVKTGKARRRIRRFVRAEECGRCSAPDREMVGKH